MMTFNIVNHLFLASRPNAIPKGAIMKVSNQKGLAIWNITLGIHTRTQTAKQTKDKVPNLLFLTFSPCNYVLTAIEIAVTSDVFFCVPSPS